MSENIVHTAIVQDSVVLLRRSPQICRPFQQAVSDHPDVAELGGITRHGDRHNPRLLSQFREAWPPAADDEQTWKRLAFVLGWMSHRAADRQMKPIWRKHLPPEERTQSPTDCSLYQDAFILREVFHQSTRRPYDPLVPTAAMADSELAAVGDIAAVERLLRAAWQRMLIALHTFIPDDDHCEDWLDNVLARHQRLTVELHRLASVFHRPDPERERRYIEETGFYDRNDPLIQLLHAQDPWSVAADDLARALAAENGCRYAQALMRAHRYHTAANDYVQGEIDRSELETRLDIGRPEVDE